MIKCLSTGDSEQVCVVSDFCHHHPQEGKGALPGMATYRQRQGRPGAGRRQGRPGAGFAPSHTWGGLGVWVSAARVIPVGLVGCIPTLPHNCVYSELPRVPPEGAPGVLPSRAGTFCLGARGISLALG